MLSRKTNKPFKDIPLDRPATYKQRWAVAWQFAKECADEFPYQSEKALAVIFNAVILKYHSDPKSTKELTHGDVQEFLSGNRECPNHYKKLIHVDLRDKANPSSSKKTKKPIKLNPLTNCQIEKFKNLLKNIITALR